ncbi:hypothetical protein RTBOTA2_005202 [Rhodotorula toruloides]|nr:hypothetical protein RTBOTA2_005202 [Rhodotorula toruloides]
MSFPAKQTACALAGPRHSRRPFDRSTVYNCSTITGLLSRADGGTPTASVSKRSSDSRSGGWSGLAEKQCRQAGERGAWRYEQESEASAPSSSTSAPSSSLPNSTSTQKQRGRRKERRGRLTAREAGNGLSGNGIIKLHIRFVSGNSKAGLRVLADNLSTFESAPVPAS